jgi:DNA-directed RNA polymerase specialized sigma24 family protein
VQQGGLPESADVLSRAEIELALAVFTAKEKAVLLRGSAFLSFMYGFDSGDDLLQEAVTRALEGRRKCPRGLPPVAFLFKCMSSIAHSASKARKRSGIVLLADAVEEEEARPPAEGHDPADVVAAQEALAKVEALFKDDVDVQILIDELAKGLKGEALRASLGVTETELDTMRKRMHRRCKDLAKPWRHL